MKLSDHDALARLRDHDHGVLCTVHPDRGVDAVPVVYALDHEGHLGVPIDTVKDKSTTRLQRERNLEADRRATLLIERWDPDDWSSLWWVRVELSWLADPDADRTATVAARLAERYPPYRTQPFARVLVFRIVGLTGWRAGPGRAPG